MNANNVSNAIYLVALLIFVILQSKDLLLSKKFKNESLRNILIYSLIIFVSIIIYNLIY